MKTKVWIRLFGGAGLALSVFGIFTMILGFMVQDSGLVTAAYIETGIGIAALAAYLFAFFGEMTKAVYQKREAVYGITGALLIFFILIGVNVVSNTKFGEKKFDLTQEKVHSLSDTSVAIVKNLPQKVEVLSFVVTPAAKGAVENLFDLYSYYSPNLELKEIDPDKDPTLLTKYSAEVDEVVLVNKETNQTTKLNRFQLNEENFTTALRRVVSGEDKVIYVLQGNTQPDLEDNKGQDGFYLAKLLLEQEGYKVKALNLLETPDIPKDANAVVSWGIARGLPEQALQILETYLDKGGKLVIGQNALIAPSKDRFSSTGYEDLLKKYGLAFKPSILVQSFQFAGRQIQVGSVVTNEFESHPMMKPLQESKKIQVQLTQAQAVEQIPGYKGKANRNTLLKTTSEVAAATDLKALLNPDSQKKSLKTDGPYPLAQIAEVNIEKANQTYSDKSSLVVYGDANFATNDLIQKANNADLFLNTFAYLLGRPDSVTVRPRNWKSSTLSADESTKQQITFASIFAIPQLILLIGLIVWTLRRIRQ